MVRSKPLIDRCELFRFVAAGIVANGLLVQKKCLCSFSWSLDEFIRLGLLPCRPPLNHELLLHRRFLMSSNVHILLQRS